MMYIVFIIDYIHHLINESKMLIFIYNNDQIDTCLKEDCGVVQIMHNSKQKLKCKCYLYLF